MKRFTRIAVGAGAVLGLSTFAAPAVAGADGPPGQFSALVRTTLSSSKLTTSLATRWLPTTALATAP